MSVVQLFNRERKARAQFAELNRIHMEAYKDAILAFALFYPAVEFIGVVAIIVSFWYGGLKSLAGLVSVGVLFAFMQWSQRFFQPIQDLSEKFNILQSAMAASDAFSSCSMNLFLPTYPLAVPSPLCGVKSNSATYGLPIMEVQTRPKTTGFSATSPSECTRRDHGHCRTHRSRQNHDHSTPPPFLRYPARPDSPRRHRYPRVQRPGSPPSVWNRAAGSFLFTGTLESNVRLGTAGVTPRPLNPRSAK